MADRLSPRQRLLEAAIETIDREGEAGVKVDRVAEAASVAKPSIYRYFHDRDGLIVAAQAERYRRGLQSQVMLTLEDVVECDDVHDFVRLLTTMMGSVAAADGATRRRLRVQVLGSAASRPELQEAIRVAHQQTIDEVAKAVAYAQRRGWMTNEYPASALIEWWLAFVLGSHVVEEYGRPTDAEAVRRVAANAVMQLIPTPSSSGVVTPT